VSINDHTRSHDFLWVGALFSSKKIDDFFLPFLVVTLKINHSLDTLQISPPSKKCPQKFDFLL